MSSTAVFDARRKAVPRVGSEARLLAAIALIYSTAFALVSSSLLSQYGFPLDDSYIYQTVARNFARTGVMGFVPGVPSSGATSVLWATLQAFNYKLLHADPVLFNLLISWCLLVSVGVLLFRLATRDGLPTLESFTFSIAPAFCGNFIWLGLLGMEHLLFVVLTLALIYFAVEQRHPASPMLAGVVAGLLALTRPEAFVVGPFLAILALLLKRPIRQIGTFLAAWSPLVILLFAANRYTSHSWMPTTMKGRSWLAFSQAGGPHSLQAILAFPAHWIFIRQQQFCLQPNSPRLTLVCLFVSSLLLLLGLAKLISRAGARIRLLLLLAGLFFAVYWVEYPLAGHGGRYQPLNLLLLFPCILLGFGYLLEQITGRASRFQRITVLVFLLIAGSASLLTWRIIALDGIAHINETHGRAAAWLVHNIPGGARVAAFDIGRVSYDWDHPIIDIGGLVDPAYIPYLVNHQVPAYLREQRVEYVVLGRKAVDIGVPATLLKELTEFCSPYSTWNIGFFYTLHSAQCQVVYRFTPNALESTSKAIDPPPAHAAGPPSVR